MIALLLSEGSFLHSKTTVRWSLFIATILSRFSSLGASSSSKSSNSKPSSVPFFPESSNLLLFIAPLLLS